MFAVVWSLVAVVPVATYIQQNTSLLALIAWAAVTCDVGGAVSRDANFQVLPSCLSVLHYFEGLLNNSLPSPAVLFLPSVHAPFPFCILPLLSSSFPTCSPTSFFSLPPSHPPPFHFAPLPSPPLHSPPPSHLFCSSSSHRSSVALTSALSLQLLLCSLCSDVTLARRNASYASLLSIELSYCTKTVQSPTLNWGQLICTMSPQNAHFQLQTWTWVLHYWILAASIFDNWCWKLQTKKCSSLIEVITQFIMIQHIPMWLNGRVPTHGCVFVLCDSTIIA